VTGDEEAHVDGADSGEVLQVPQRRISGAFIKQFESEAGILHPILVRLQHDDTLSLE
jgi:hypothetical protein